MKLLNSLAHAKKAFSLPKKVCKVTIELFDYEPTGFGTQSATRAIVTFSEKPKDTRPINDQDNYTVIQFSGLIPEVERAVSLYVGTQAVEELLTEDGGGVMGLCSSVVGRTVTLRGNLINGDLVVNSDGNRIVINGQSYDTGSNLPFTVVVEGDVKGRIDTASGDVEVQGNSASVKTMSGDVTIQGQVEGDVGTMSGDVSAGAINGNVKTMSGDIRRL